jgi:peptide deformylase
MAIRRILNVADARDVAVLKSISTPVEAVDDELRALMDDMLDTMYDAPGIGLAAVQIGVPKRGGRDGPGARGGAPGAALLCQPGDQLAFGGAVRIRGGLPVGAGSLRRGGAARALPTELPRLSREPGGGGGGGVVRRLYQHEMDHLEGVLFIDYLSRLKRDRAVKAVRKLVREAQAA